ncbi:MAG: FixH family protein [Flavobacteriales bacterium]|nr:FixH family protein [Flavobacteriales bacterium]
MGWGKGIALSYIGFVIFMLGLVYLAVNQDFDLVADDYYEQEIAYQGRIDELTNALDDNQKVVVSNVGDAVQLVFPSKATDVKIHFFRPSDDTMDFKVEEASVDSELNVAHSQFTKGKYLVKVQWLSNGKTYFQEDGFYVN